MEALDASIKTPFNMIIAGPSQSGKTQWVRRLLLYVDSLLDRGHPPHIHWYSPRHSQFEERGIIFHLGLPWEGKRCEDEEEAEEEKEEIEPKEGDLIVIDDFAQETANSRELTNYITKQSHHRNISIIVLSQNLFWGGKETRNQSLNMHYIVLMRQSRDHKQIRTLGRQLTPNEKQYKFFLEAYNDATGKRLFSYLLISMHPRDDPKLLLRTNIFPEEGNSATVYLPSTKKYK